MTSSDSLLFAPCGESRFTSRREFLVATLAFAIAGSARAADRRPPRILLKSSWQTVNIGDIAHTPGVIQLLGEHLPDAEITLWPNDIGNGVDEMLRKNFPKLRIVQNPEEVKRAFGECDFLLHGSGPSLVGQKGVTQWARETGKPYGVYGITFSSKDPGTIELLSKARFVFFRDTVSMQFAKDHGVTCPVMEFGPDGAFGVKLRNDEAATAFLQARGLEDGKFLCVIPRYRNTPYWKIKTASAFDEAKHQRNEALKEHDHAQLRAAIIAVVRETPIKVLICPEDMTQMELGKNVLFDPLPEDVKPRVVWRENYWLTDEALSTYQRSAGLFGNEMHSPIMCIGNGIPAIVCRWGEQTSKGFMWRDIGLTDWLFNLDDEADLPRIAPAVLAMARDPAAAKAKAAKAREFVEERQRETMAIVAKSLHPV
jgi:polysaccharide pyruvyl transferase WcaK-like protein